MKLKIAICAAVSCLALLPAVSNAKGCLKGAAVGAVGGHVAGHHGLIGAAAGCVINHHRNAVKDQKAVAAASQPGQNPQISAPAAPAPSPVKQN